MAAELAIQTVGMDALVGRMVKLAKGIPEAERRGVEKAALLLLREAVKNFRSGTPGQSDPDKITSRTGKMRQSLAAQKPEQIKDGWQARVGYRESAVGQYVEMHERKGPTTITPKGARILAIPLPPQMKPSGEPRFSSPTQVKGAWVRSKKGNLVFLEATTGLPYFLGKDKVTINPRRPLGKATESTKRERSRVINAEFKRLAREAVRGA
jgi:hypothetical protein